MEVYSYEFDRSLFFPASLAKEMKYFFKNMLLHEFGKLFLKKGRTVAEAPAGVQYRVARLPVNWRGRLARK